MGSLRLPTAAEVLGGTKPLSSPEIVDCFGGLVRLGTETGDSYSIC
jgi:hypothetical protein